MKAIHKHAAKPLDVHLMIEKPERYIHEFKAAGAAVLTVHLEASTHLHRTLAAIRAEGMKAGVALNPHSPISLLEDIIVQCDLICLMSVNPGFGGQSFIEGTYQKIKTLKQLIQSKGSSALIEIDGGVTLSNAGALLAAGADVLVAGNTVFGHADPTEAIRLLKNGKAEHNARA
jgi:ribulose-phosphate 3-epimerase